MKTKILAIVLLFASFTFAQLNQANDTKKQTIDKTDFHARSGLYFSTGLTFGYEFLNNRAIEDYDEYHSTQKFLFDAWLIPFIEVRLGGYISNSAISLLNFRRILPFQEQGKPAIRSFFRTMQWPRFRKRNIST